jgi:hypothetical protein
MNEVKIKKNYGCGTGWNSLIDNIIKEILKYNADKTEDTMIHISTIKEKFGGLRIYITPSIDYIEDLIDKAEDESYRTCEECGSTTAVSTNTDGWKKTLCNSCRNKT